MDGCLSNLASNEVQSLVNLVKSEAQYLCCFNSHVENFEHEKTTLETKHNYMKEKLKEATGIFSIKSEAEDWVNKAGDIINVDTRTKKKCCFDLCPNCWWQYWRGKELAKKTEYIKGLLGRCNTYIVAGRAYLPIKEYFSSQKFIHFKSRESEFQVLMKELEDDSCNMVGLLGMGGMGKTCMVKEVSSKLEGSRFDKVFLLEVSTPPNFEELRVKLAKHLHLPIEKEEDLSKTIWYKLVTMEEKLLIILDDVWEPFDVKQQLGIPYFDEHKGCTVLITTRKESVCKTMECRIIIELKRLDDEDALGLFQKNVGNINDSVRGWKGEQKRIVDHCGGLPVAIAAISKALKNQTGQVWKDALISLKYHDGDHNWNTAYGCLEFSYNNLKVKKAKELFMISSLFPKGRGIPEQLLSIIGIGLGSYWGNSEYHLTRSEVLAAITELKDSSLLLNIGRSVKMHDLVHEMALRIRGEEFQVMNSKMPKNHNTRYLFWKNPDFHDEFDGKELEFLLISLDYAVDLKVLLDAFLMKMTRLKVLILEITSECEYGISASSLLHSLQSLTNIQTLNLKKLQLGDISILEKLLNLVTLSLCYCSIIKLPKEFSNIKKLGLLELEMCEIKMNNPFEVIERCSQLEELTFVGNWCGKEEKDAIAQNESSLSLHRYQISYESLTNYHDNHGSMSKCFRVDDSRHLLSEALFKKLVGETELLILEGRYEDARWKNLIPGIVSLDEGGMDELMILHSSSCPDIECLIDTQNHASNVIAFPNLAELHLYEMDVEDLYQGPMPSDFLKQLKIMKLKECQKLKNVLFNGNFNLCCLESIELEHCPMLTSIFQKSTAQTVEQLEELRIKNCKALEYIITNESSGGGIVHDGDHDQECYGSLFPKLKSLQITGCDQLEIVLPMLFAESLPSLEETSICECKQLKYIFSGNFSLCSLKSMELEDCPMLTSIFQQSTAHTLEQLEELRIKNCKALDYIMTYKSSGGGIVGGDRHQECYGSLFPKLKTIQITGCDQLELVLPILFSAGLSSLEQMSICECRKLKYIFEFDKLVEEDHDMLPLLQEMELSAVPSLIGIYKECQQPMASSMEKAPSQLSRDNSKQILRCPGTCVLSWAQTCFLNDSRTANKKKLLDRAMQQSSSASKKWTSAFDILKRLHVHHIKKLKIVNLSLKSASLFTLFTASEILWEELKIGKCIGLKQLISSNVNDSKDPITRSSIFPKLEKLEIRECKDLEFLFPFTTSVGIENLKSLTIIDAPELRYVIGNQRDDPSISPNAMPHFYLPALESLYFKHAPKLISICVMNFMLALPSLVTLKTCGIKSVTKLMLCSNEERLNQEASKEIHASIDGVPLFQEAQNLMARTLKNIVKMKLQNCPELTSVLFLPVASMVLLENLIIEGCHKLKCVVADEGDAQVAVKRCSIFPRLNKLVISDCKELEFLFPATLSIEIKKLDSLEVSNALELKYVVGKHEQEGHLSNQNQNVELQFVLPSLQSLSLQDVPNLVNFCPENYCLKELSRVFIRLERSLSIRSITDFMVWDNTRQQNSISKEEMVMRLHTLEFLMIKNSKLENVLNLRNLDIKENENRLEPLPSSLRSLSLEGLSELRNICVGPEHILRLNKLSYLEIKACGKLEVVFSTSTLRSLPQLKTLKISDCDELIHIIEEDRKKNVKDDLHHEPCFPNLIELTVERCRKLKYLFSITVSGILPKLSELDIKEVSNLEHILIRQETKEMGMKDVLPKLRDLKLYKLQSLVSICHGIDFKTLEQSSRVHDCSTFSFHETTVTDQLQDGFKNLDFEAEAETHTPRLCCQTFQGKETTEEIVEEDVLPEIADSNNSPLQVMLVGREVKNEKIMMGPQQPTIGAPNLAKTSQEAGCSAILEAPDSKKTDETTNPLTDSKIVEAGGSSKTLHPSYLKKVPIPVGPKITSTTIRISEGEEEGDPSMPRALNISRGQTSETMKATMSLKQTPLSIGFHPESSYGKKIQNNVGTINQPLHEALATVQVSSEHVKHDAIEIMPHFNVTSNAFRVHVLQEIVDMMKLECAEASILAEAFKTHPQLCLSMEDRSTSLLRVSYRVLLDILNILDKKNPFTITEEDKKSLVENLKDALVLGFDKDWLESVKSKVFNYDESGVHHMQQVLESLEDKLETNKKELAKVCDKEDEATRRVEVAQKALEAVRARHYQLSKECEYIQKQQDHCRETITTKFGRFGF